MVGGVIDVDNDEPPDVVEIGRAGTDAMLTASLWSPRLAALVLRLLFAAGFLSVAGNDGQEDRLGCFELLASLLLGPVILKMYLESSGLPRRNFS